MPALALADGLAVLAFALVAIVAVDLVRQFVVSPLYATSNRVSSVAVIGGPLAYAINLAAALIDETCAALSWMAQQGRNDAVNGWIWLVQNTVGWIFAPTIYWAQWVADRNGAIAWVLIYWDRLWAQAWTTVPALIGGVANDLAGLHRWIDTVEMPIIRGIGDDLAGLHKWLDTVEMPIIRGIGDDLAGLHKWLDDILVPNIDRAFGQVNDRIRHAEQDIARRALESEAEQLRARVTSLERQVALLMALGVIAAAGTDVIENLRCIGSVKCSLLDPLLNGDLEDRLTELEINGG